MPRAVVARREGKRQETRDDERFVVVGGVKALAVVGCAGRCRFGRRGRLQPGADTHGQRSPAGVAPEGSGGPGWRSAKADGFLNCVHRRNRRSARAGGAGRGGSLQLRVEEVYALDKLSEISKTEIFATAFGKAAAQKVAAIANVVADPSGPARPCRAGSRASRGASVGRRWSRPTS